MDASGAPAPVVCYAEGKAACSVLNSPANALSSVDFITDTFKRCLRCPACLGCDFDGYQGLPFVSDGSTIVLSTFTNLDGSRSNMPSLV